MNSFKTYFKKEFKEGIRNYKYLIIGASIILLAVFDPIMLKMLPKILASQSNISIPAEMLMETTQKFALQNFLKDINQIVNIVVVFSLMGIMADEIRDKTIVFPYSKGVSNIGVVLAKFVNYGIMVSIFLFLGLSLNYYYSGVLFKDGAVEFIKIIKVTGLISIYYLFNISVIIFMSSLSKKSIVVGLSSMGIIFLLPLIGEILPIKEYLPNHLLQQSNIIISSADSVNYNNSLLTIICVVLIIIVINFFTIFKMNRSEIA